MFDFLPITAVRVSLEALALANLLSPIGMCYLRSNQRWALWTWVYVGIFAGSYLSRDYFPWSFEGILLLFASLIGASIGLFGNLRGKTNLETDLVRGRWPRRGRCLIGFFVGVGTPLLILFPLLAVTFPLRGQVIEVLEWGMEIRAYDQAINFLVGLIYLILALGAARAWYVVDRSGWWRVLWSGCFIGATLVGAFFFAFH